MGNHGSADDVAKDSSGGGGIQEHDFAEEVSNDLPSMAMLSSAPSGTSPYASLSSPSAAKVDDRDVAHGAGRVGDAMKLEHALPTDPMQLPAGFGMVDSMGRPPVVYASDSDVDPGGFPVRPARNTATSRTSRSPIHNEEFEEEYGVPISAAAGIGVYAVEAQRVPDDGNEDGTVLVAEAKYVKTKRYQRRWITLGLALLACGLVVVVDMFVLGVLVTRPRAGATPEAIACTFLSISNVTKCRSTYEFSSDTYPNDKTTFSTIPSEIGLLTQLTYLNFFINTVTSTIPSEIGLLTQLMHLSIDSYSLSSTIPSDIGLLTQLTCLGFINNALASTIPSEIGLLTQLKRLVFVQNLLTSTIPSEIGLLTQLTALTFKSNSLTLAIPSEIGLLTQLMYLSFAENSLTSTIPSEIGLLTQLTRLDFSDNTLTGTIPSSLCSLPSLPHVEIDCGKITCASGCCSGPDNPFSSSFCFESERMNG